MYIQFIKKLINFRKLYEISKHASVRSRKIIFNMQNVDETDVSRVCVN